MEPNVGETQVYFSSNPWFKRKLFWVIFTLAMVSIPVGAWVYANYFMKPSPSTQPQASQSAQIRGKVIAEDKLPIALDILQNPMVYEWRGSVEGVLVAKDEKSFTLNDKDGNEITIRIITSSVDITGTKFYKSEPVPDKDGRKFTEVNINDITIGSKLHGDFFVFPHQKDELVGSSFNIVE